VFRSALAKVLKSLRADKAFSQEKLAEVAGIHPTYVSLLERGKKSPTVDTLRQIAKGLDIPTWELIKQAEELDKNR
jgi:transcriptional regulator with XRE-family HTH domain